MGKPHYFTQLQRKIKTLNYERKQVVKHLALLDQKIDTLNQALHIMQSQENIEQHSTDNFTYRQRFWLFKGKIRKYILPMLKEMPDKGFTIAEITQRIFDIEQNTNIPSSKHRDSVRKQLNKFYQDGLITRTEINKEVYWQWKN